MTASDIEDELDLAFDCFAKGEIRRAEQLAQDVLRREPDSPDALHLLGVIAAQTNRRGQAMELLRRAIALDPESAEAQSDLGHLLKIDGNIFEAVSILERACRTDPLSANAQNGLGEAYISADRPLDAEQCFRKAMALAPNLATPVYNLGVSLQAQGRELEAIAEFRNAIALAPELGQAQLRLGGLLVETGRRDEAHELFERFSQRQPESVFGRICRATYAFEKGQWDVAEKALREALASEPDEPGALSQLGAVLTRRGKFVEAVECFSRAIAIDPRRVEAYAGLSEARKATRADEPIIRQMLLQLDRTQSDRNRAGFHFALGKTYDQLGDYESAMRHYDAANATEARRLNALGRGFDIVQHANAIDQTIQTFSAELLARTAEFGSDSDLPVLILGMPRSGTTLVEQILSSHPAVAAGDELTFWGDKFTQFGALEPSFRMTAIRQIAGEYLDLLRSIGPHALRVTDKMPRNYQYLWLIHLAFPNARIIHCRRNSIDTCLSIYFAHFGRQDYAFDRSQIVFVYKRYLRLMAHWRKVLPSNRMLEVDYEKLVADPEPLTREMVAFCGLDWNEACLHPEKNERPIMTASMRQARQPVYTSSAGRWHHYGPWLREFAELKSYAECQE